MGVNKQRIPGSFSFTGVLACLATFPPAKKVRWLEKQLLATFPPNMGLCGSKHIIKWAPDDDDKDTAWMEDYDGMMQQMIASDASPDQWELDLAQEGLMNPTMKKKGDLKYGHTKQQRVAAWFKFKKAVHQLNGDRSEDLIRTLAMTKLGASPYLQMRAKQWMELLKQQKLELEADMNNRRANTEGDIQSSTGSKYAAAMQIAANEEQATN